MNRQHDLDSTAKHPATLAIAPLGLTECWPSFGRDPLYTRIRPILASRVYIYIRISISTSISISSAG